MCLSAHHLGVLCPSSFSSSPLLLFLTPLLVPPLPTLSHHALCPSSFSSSLAYSLSHTMRYVPPLSPPPLPTLSLTPCVMSLLFLLLPYLLSLLHHALCPSSFSSSLTYSLSYTMRYVLPLSPPPLPTLSLTPYSLSQLPYLSPYTMCLSAHHHGVLCPSSFFLVPLLLPCLLSLTPCVMSFLFLLLPYLLSLSHHALCPSSFSSSLAYSLSLIPCVMSHPPPPGRNPYCIDKNYGTYITVLVSHVQHCHLSNEGPRTRVDQPKIKYWKLHELCKNAIKNVHTI